MEITNEDVSSTRSEENGARGAEPGGAPRRLIASSLLWLAVIVALGIVMPFVPVPSAITAIAGAVALTVVYVVAVVLFSALSTREVPSTKQRFVFFAIALALWALLQFVVSPAVFDLFMALRAEKVAPSAAQNLLRFSVLTFTDASLLCAAVFGGAMIARLINSPNMLGPICAVVALIDIWGVLLGGIVSQVIEKAPEIASRGMASMPTAGAATASKFIIPLPDIGAGDYLFLGLLFAALHGNRMNWRGAVKLITPLVIIALLAIPLSGILVAMGRLKQEIMLPGLVFIGMGAALPNLRYFEYSREEKFALIYAALFVVVLTAALYFGVTYFLPPERVAFL